MTRPQDMGPADLAPNTVPPETLTPEQARKVERNAFYNSLPPEAKERFLAALERAADAGLDEDAAWAEAANAAEAAYPEEELPETREAYRSDVPPGHEPVGPRA